MIYVVSIPEAKAMFPEYEFISALTPSVQKAAFHIRNSEGNDLCLKIISPEYNIIRLNREITALQTISHPNVVELFEYTYSTSNGIERHYMIEKFIKGNDLTILLIEGKPWARSDAAPFFASLCDGLNELFEKRIVHRDLKPSNIRVKEDGSPIIIDFGLARHLSLPDLTNTEDGAGFGTPKYFSPEQFEGTKYDIDHRTDIFALGIILYQAVMGIHPFYHTGISRQNLHAAICTSNAHLENAEFRSLPNQWQVLISKMLGRHRAQRPQNAGQIGAILRKIEGV